MSRRTGNGAQPVERKNVKTGKERIKELEEYARTGFECATLSKYGDNRKEA